MQDFNDIIKPLVAARPVVFGSAEYYNEDLYNHMGSLILSRSFHVDDPEEDDDKDDEINEEEDENDEAETSTASLMRAADGMDIHNDTGLLDEAVDGEEDDEDEDDEEDEVTHISMVPWADMLNARHGCDNARLFYEKDCLNMTSTKAIRKGEQIVRETLRIHVKLC
jgi:SET domain-containing protein 6